MEKSLYLLIFFTLFIPLYTAAESLSDSKGNSPLEVETLTVTAEKRSSDIQDLTMSISAFSDEDLYDAGIDDIRDTVRLAPNVYVKYSSVVIRGISQYYGAKFPAVGFFQDGISLPFEGMENTDLFDIERIEILKGPQGTLYGKNSEAGVINIITKKPGNDFSAKAFSEYSWYDTEFGNSYGYIGGGSINYPVAEDKLFLRVAGKWRDYAGFVKNEFNDDEEAGADETLNGRASIRWTPDPKWNISILSDKMYKDFSNGYCKYVNGSNYEGRNRISYNGPYDNGEKQSDGQTISVEYKGDNINFLSLTGRRDIKNTFTVDFDLTSKWNMASYYLDENTDYSQEFRISSSEDIKKFKWLTGFYIFDQDMKIYQKKDWKPESRTTDIENNGYAFFGQGTYTLFNRLHLTAGLRYDYIDSKGTQDFETTSGISTYGKDFDNCEILPKVAVSYNLSDEIMAYTSYTRGYLPGGYNAKWATDKNNLSYEAEYTVNYETGIKGSWFENRLITNLSAFYIKMDDKQVAEWDSSSGGVGVNMIKNAANAYSKGFEFDLKARPIAGVDFIAGFGFTEAEIDDWVATEFNKATGQTFKYDYNGKELPNVPSYTFNLGIQYRSRSGLFCRGDLLGTGEMYSDPKNTAKEDEYKIVNLRFGYESEKFDIILWCKNLFNEEYLKVRFAGGGDHQGFEGEPRMFGTSFTYRF